MAQFDIYENPNGNHNGTVPFLLDVQADLLGDLATRVVVPLVATSAGARAVKHLNPIFKVLDTEVVMSTAELAGVGVHVLGAKVASLQDHRAEIIAALDFLFTGF